MGATEASQDLDEILYLSSSSLDVEEERLIQARQEIPDISTKYDRVVIELYQSLCSKPSEAHENALRFGRELIHQSVTQSVANNLVADDRPLYWSRLMGMVAIRNALSQSENSDQGLITQTCETWERESRNLMESPTTKLDPSKDPIVLSGFDPFNLDNNLAQSNPSAVIALTLAQRKIRGHPVRVSIFPVRYDDFDAGSVERIFKPIFLRPIRLVLTISMGRNRFDLERYPGRRRSSDAPDNRRRIGPVEGEPVASTDGPEFLEFTLPASSMTKVQGEWSVVDNRRVNTLESGEFEAESLEELAEETAIEGSGGGFLSNEISYRTRLLEDHLGLEFPLGHLHVPRIVDYDPKTLRNMTSQTHSLIVAALESSK